MTFGRRSFTRMTESFLSSPEAYHQPSSSIPIKLSIFLSFQRFLIHRLPVSRVKKRHMENRQTRREKRRTTKQIISLMNFVFRSPDAFRSSAAPRYTLKRTHTLNLMQRLGTLPKTAAEDLSGNDVTSHAKQMLGSFVQVKAPRKENRQQIKIIKKRRRGR